VSLTDTTAMALKPLLGDDAKWYVEYHGGVVVLDVVRDVWLVFGGSLQGLYRQMASDAATLRVVASGADNAAAALAAA